VLAAEQGRVPHVRVLDRARQRAARRFSFHRFQSTSLIWLSYLQWVPFEIDTFPLVQNLYFLFSVLRQWIGAFS
jgi:uncharacterized protein YhbP (UPF0306 family)